MPRYGDAHSVKWFEVEASSVFHIINCFEDGDEVKADFSNKSINLLFYL